MAGDGGDNRFFQETPRRAHPAGALDPLRPESVLGDDFEIGEGAVRASQHADQGRIVALERFEGLKQRNPRLGIDGVARLWPIDGNDGHRAVFVDA